MKTKELLNLSAGDKILKSEMRKLITGSKLESSEYWQGEDYIINNTYQQGINWIGSNEKTLAVIVKSKPGKYSEDATANGIHYAFQAIKGKINKDSKANRALINSKKQQYPILYFSDYGQYWKFEGKFIVKTINEKDVELEHFNTGTVNKEVILIKHENN